MALPLAARKSVDFSYKMQTIGMMQPVDKKILSRIYGRKRGSVLVPNDFLDLGSRSAIDLALHRLAKRGQIRRLTRGLYDYPKVHPKLGVLLPPPEKIAQAIAGRDNIRLQPAGAYAANLLGLSEQVPAKAVFLTEGTARNVRIGRLVVQLRHTSPRNMAAAGTPAGLVIQALRYLGKQHVTAERITTLARTLPKSERKNLVKHLRAAPIWMHPIIHQLAEA